MDKTPRRIVTVELPESVYAALIEEARLRNASSHHQRAREIVVEHFINPELQGLRERIDELDLGVTYLGELLRRTTYSVMVHAAKRTSDEANEWIREHLPHIKG